MRSRSTRATRPDYQEYQSSEDEDDDEDDDAVVFVLPPGTGLGLASMPPPADDSDSDFAGLGRASTNAPAYDSDFETTTFRRDEAEDDIAMAIELSLQETQGCPPAAELKPFKEKPPCDDDDKKPSARTPCPQTEGRRVTPSPLQDEDSDFEICSEEKPPCDADDNAKEKKEKRRKHNLTPAQKEWANSFAAEVSDVIWETDDACEKWYQELKRKYGAEWLAKKNSKVYPSIQQQVTQQIWKDDPKNLACIPEALRPSAFLPAEKRQRKASRNQATHRAKSKNVDQKLNEARAHLQSLKEDARAQLERDDDRPADTANAPERDHLRGRETLASDAVVLPAVAAAGVALADLPNAEVPHSNPLFRGVAMPNPPCRIRPKYDSPAFTMKFVSLVDAETLAYGSQLPSWIVKILLSTLREDLEARQDSRHAMSDRELERSSLFRELLKRHRSWKPRKRKRLVTQKEKEKKRRSDAHKRNRDRKKHKECVAVHDALLSLREQEQLLGQGTNGRNFLTIAQAQSAGCYSGEHCVLEGANMYHVTDKVPNGEDWVQLPMEFIDDDSELGTEPILFHADLGGQREAGRPRIYEPRENFRRTYASPVLQVAFHHANVHNSRGTFERHREYYVGIIYNSNRRTQYFRNGQRTEHMRYYMHSSTYTKPDAWFRGNWENNGGVPTLTQFFP